jgi:hypothetical protein
MANATFEEYQAAKNEIIGGAKYHEHAEFPNQYGMMSRHYGATASEISTKSPIRKQESSRTVVITTRA